MCPDQNCSDFPLPSFPPSHPHPEAEASPLQLLPLGGRGWGEGWLPETSDKWWPGVGGLPTSSWPLPLSGEASAGQGEDEDQTPGALTGSLPVPSVLPQEILRELTLDALLDMNEAKVKETLGRCGASAEECGRLQYALTCLRKVTGLGR